MASSSRFRRINRVQNRCSFALAQGSPLKALEEPAGESSSRADSSNGDDRWALAFEGRLASLERSLEAAEAARAAAERAAAAAVTKLEAERRRAADLERRLFAERRRADAPRACDGSCAAAASLRGELRRLKAALADRDAEISDLAATVVGAKLERAEALTDLDKARKPPPPPARAWRANRDARRSRSLSVRIMDVVRNPSAALFDDDDADAPPPAAAAAPNGAARRRHAST